MLKYDHIRKEKKELKKGGLSRSQRWSWNGFCPFINERYNARRGTGKNEGIKL